jgi:ankyrin repeat protein
MYKSYNIPELAWAGNLKQIMEIVNENPFHPIDAKDSNGKNGFLYSAENNHFDVMNYLIEEGSCMYETDNRGNNGLALAVGNGSNYTSMYLLERGLNPNSLLNGVSLLHIALSNKNMVLIAELVKHGADPTDTNHYGYDCLQVASMTLPESQNEIFRGLLLEKGWI